jgi:hypothetical protein
MALGTKTVGSISGAGVAAATSRVGHGGRNVASTSRLDVERSDFSPQMGVNEESILRFQQENGQLNPDGRRQSQSQRDGFTPLLNRGSLGFEAEAAAEQTADGAPKLFLTDVLRGVSSYEENIRVTTPGTAKPGSVMNYLF